MLYIVSTPIGNIKDITLRAIDVMQTSDLILAEDTRRTKILMKEYGIKKKVITYNDHNKEIKTRGIIKLLKEGHNISLVSDAGTPGISDPGFFLVRACREQKVTITPIPGPSSFLSALVCSGLPTDSFCFYGFLSKKEKKKKDFFESIKDKTETIIVYESTHRIDKTLKIMEEVLPESNVCLAREMTKKFEEFIIGSPAEIIEKAEKLKGEIVLVISNK